MQTKLASLAMLNETFSVIFKHRESILFALCFSSCGGSRHTTNVHLKCHLRWRQQLLTFGLETTVASLPRRFWQNPSRHRIDPKLVVVTVVHYLLFSWQLLAHCQKQCLKTNLDLVFFCFSPNIAAKRRVVLDLFGSFPKEHTGNIDIFSWWLLSMFIFTYHLKVHLQWNNEKFSTNFCLKIQSL